MAELLNLESRRQQYSWWWDSHIIPRYSKWLQENLTDMDAKLEAMINLIEEDADSFARRAEMYNEKRPELMKLVEEFYRPYRALAERYDHATVELRHAYRIIAEAFPNQAPYLLSDDSSSPSNSYLDRFDDQLHSRFVKSSSDENQRLSDSEQAEKSEGEFQTLKSNLAEVQAMKDDVLLQYQTRLEKLTNLERDLDSALKFVGDFDERASRSEIEFKILKEALREVEDERDSVLLKYNHCLEKKASLENLFALTREDAGLLNETSIIAETYAQNLKQQIFCLEAEKEADLLLYKQCLEKISLLEAEIFLAEGNSEELSKQRERKETEIEAMKKAIDEMNEKKERAYDRKSSEAIAKMKVEKSRAEDEVKETNSELIIEAMKLKNVEDRCSLLERLNQSLTLELDGMGEKIAVKDREIEQKQDQLKKLQILMQQEKSQFIQVETTLRNLQNLHSQSQEEQKNLTSELKDGLQMLKDLDICKHGMEEELQLVKEENRNLNEQNFSSMILIKNLENEVCTLKEMKEELENEIALKADKMETLQQEIGHMREEMEGLNKKYETVIKQVEEVGLNPECIESYVKNLQYENTNLREAREMDRIQKESLYEKLNSMDRHSKNNALMEITLAEANGEIGCLREKIHHLEESYQLLKGEKSNLISEKSILLSQLETLSENMKKLLEKNTLMENSLSGANVEIEVLRAKSKTLEELFKSVNDEKSVLVNEKGALMSQMEIFEERMRSLENGFTKLEGIYCDLEKEKESAFCQVKELRSSLLLEKEKRENYMHSNETRLARLEFHFDVLQDENRRVSKEELDKVIYAQVDIFILQKFIEDLEGKNCSLIFECQRQAEASLLSGKLISELEIENLEQQVEVQFLLDQVEKLRTGIVEVSIALQFDAEKSKRVRSEQEETPIGSILDSIENLKSSFMKTKEVKQQLQVENSVLLTLIEQIRINGSEVESEKNILEEEIEIMKEKLFIHEKEKNMLQVTNRQLRLEVNEKTKSEDVLIADMESLNVRIEYLQGAHEELREDNCNLVEQKKSLLENFSALKDEKHILEEVHSVILLEAVAFGIFSMVLESFMKEKSVELKDLINHFERLTSENGDFKEEIQIKEIENLELNWTVKKLDKEVNEVKDLYDQLSNQLSENTRNQKLQMESLCEANGNLKSEVDMLQSEIEESWIREKIRSLVLMQEIRDVYEHKEAFYFDLQVSSFNEILLVNKVRELVGVCEKLEDESAGKGREIKQMRETVSFLESEIGGLESQLSAYIPAIASLIDNVASLENSILPETPHCHGSNEEEKEGDGILDLQNMNNRIKAIEMAAVEEMKKTRSVNDKAVDGVAEEARSRRNSREKGIEEEMFVDNLKSKNNDLKNKISIKDIPLDQTLDTSQVTPPIPCHQIEDAKEKGEASSSSEVNLEKELGIDKLGKSEEGRNREEILERLSFDAKNLMNLQTRIQYLKKRTEISNQAEYEEIEKQLQDVEEVSKQQINENGKLVTNIKTSLSLPGNHATEQVMKESEKIEELGSRVEKIKNELVKLEERKKDEGKKSRVKNLVRDFNHSSGSSSDKWKKPSLCGCMRSLTNGD